jgi:hypothetical protein
MEEKDVLKRVATNLQEMKVMGGLYSLYGNVSLQLRISGKCLSAASHHMSATHHKTAS